LSAALKEDVIHDFGRHVHRSARRLDAAERTIGIRAAVQHTREEMWIGNQKWTSRGG